MADGERPSLLKGPVVIDPVFSSAWAPLITFLALLSAPNIGGVSAQKGVEFMPRMTTVHRILLHTHKDFYSLIYRGFQLTKKNYFLFCGICVQISIISLD